MPLVTKASLHGIIILDQNLQTFFKQLKFKGKFVPIQSIPLTFFIIRQLKTSPVI